MSRTESSEAENDIYVNAEEPTDKIDSDIIREAQELAARGMAMNDLTKMVVLPKPETSM